MKAIAGIDDVDEDGESELVFVDNQSELAVLTLDGDNGDGDSGWVVGDSYSIGHSSGYEAGDPADFRVDTDVEVTVLNNEPTAILVDDGVENDTRPVGLDRREFIPVVMSPSSIR